MPLVVDGLARTKREGVVFVVEGEGKVEEGRWRMEGGGGES